MPALLPIDAHAHVRTDIDERELRALRAVVFAVTREPNEWGAAARRQDRACIWGLGCHPQVVAAFTDFSSVRLAEMLERVPLIGEVGLDRRSKVPMAQQKDVFRQVLEVARVLPRLVSIHSVGATAEVLREMEVQPVPGAILHWWRGDAVETSRAIDLGCYFSLNGAEVRRPKVLSLLPRDRVLTETDYPHTKKSDKAADRPGAVATTESALAEAWGEDAGAVRNQVWMNFAQLCRRTRTSALLPRAVQASLLSVR